ncbi:M56 family metallopeptidase [Paenibacillus sp.]|uniref:M56 family metallopeptidase n=1 Tax=Paenibacillus sp. TaxID=58172 RepID=UPI0028111109|nr:M56 family metallopeptidase [Paenibacillus sp.]
MMRDLFVLILEASIAAAAVSALLLACRSVLRRKVSPRWSYALWLILLLRLLWPLQLETPLPIGVLPATVESVQAPPLEAEIHAKPGKDGPVIIADREQRWLKVATYVWIVGIAFLFLYYGGSHLNFALEVRRSSKAPSEDLINAFEAAKAKTEVGGDVRLTVSDAVSSPVLVGLWRSCIIVPAREADKRSTTEWMHVFVHELVHHRRKDVIVNAFAFTILALHWFNPFLWFSYRSMREDQEMSCDMRAVALLGPSERYSYGLTLLASAEQKLASMREGYPAAVHYLRKRGSLLWKRIELLGEDAAPSRLIPVVVCLLAITTGCVVQPDANTDPKLVTAAYYHAISRLDYEKAYEFDYHQIDDQGIPKEEWLKRIGAMYRLIDRARSIQLKYKVGESISTDDGAVAVPVTVDFVRYHAKGSKLVVSAMDEVHLRERKGEWYVSQIVTKEWDHKFYQEP